jgi:hypothetical protein
MLWGYVRSMAERKERYGDEQFRSFLRRYHWQCLLTGKRRATQRLNDRQAPHWRASIAPAPATAARAESTHPPVPASVQ